MQALACPEARDAPHGVAWGIHPIAPDFELSRVRLSACKMLTENEHRQQPKLMMTKHITLGILAVCVLVGCDKEKAAIDDKKEATKDAIDNRKDAVDATAAAAKKQAEVDAAIEKAKIEANKAAAQAQLDAEKKKAEAQAAFEKAKVDAEKKLDPEKK